jgi:hypothetical protein
MAVIVGYIPHELILATTEAGNYVLNFNIRTYDNENNPQLIPSVAFNETAKTLYEEFEKKDTIVVWGQLIHRYLQSKNVTTLTVKVIAYSIVVDIADFLYEPSLSIEKKTFLKKASELFDKNAPLPTNDEIKYWREHWKDYKKKNYDPKIPKDRYKKE